MRNERCSAERDGEQHHEREPGPSRTGAAPHEQRDGDPDREGNELAHDLRVHVGATAQHELERQLGAAENRECGEASHPRAHRGSRATGGRSSSSASSPSTRPADSSETANAASAGNTSDQIHSCGTPISLSHSEPR